MLKQIFQIQITLHASKPRIWRRILVPSDMLMYDFHWVIQVAMGWMDSHLHEFMHGRDRFAPQDEDMDEDVTDYAEMTIRDFMSKEGEKAKYIYDFGDYWVHDLVLEKILSDDGKVYPRCTAGKNNCPPEDCGGIPGYMNMLEILKDPKHPEFEDITEWLGDEDGFDVEYFDKDEVNEVFTIEFGAN